MTHTKNTIGLIACAAVLLAALLVPSALGLFSVNTAHAQDYYIMENEAVVDPSGVSMLPKEAGDPSQIRIYNVNVEYGFPSNAFFRVTASSSSRIVSASLYYSVEKYDMPTVYSKVIVPVHSTAELTVNLTQFIDMGVIGNFPPDTVVNYWWQFSDQNGNTAMSNQNVFITSDSTNDWQNRTEGQLTIYWYKSSDKLIDAFFKAAQDGFKRIKNDLGIELEENVRLYFFPSTGAFQAALTSTSSWAGGIAFAEYNTVMIGCEEANISWGKETVAHELAHLATRQIAGNAYTRIPTWLSEGISVYAEGTLSTERRNMINNAMWNSELFSVMYLASPFPSADSKARLAYAQSYAYVDFLLGQGGKSKLQELLHLIGTGVNIDNALVEIYGFNQDEMTSKWYKSIGAPQGGGLSMNPVFIIFGVGVIAVIASSIILTIQQNKKNAQRAQKIAEGRILSQAEDNEYVASDFDLSQRYDEDFEYPDGTPKYLPAQTIYYEEDFAELGDYLPQDQYVGNSEFPDNHPDAHIYNDWELDDEADKGENDEK